MSDIFVVSHPGCCGWIDSICDADQGEFYIVILTVIMMPLYRIFKRIFHPLDWSTELLLLLLLVSLELFICRQGFDAVGWAAGRAFGL